MCIFNSAAVAFTVAVLAKDEEPEKLGTVIGIDLGKQISLIPQKT